MSPSPRLRFAPSPTGYLHVGRRPSALFNWLFARREGGEFLLRIEDTDTERNRPELTDNILEMLEWLGLELGRRAGPPVRPPRPATPRRPSSSLADGRAYWCDCTPEQVQARDEASGGGPPGYDGFCRDRGLERGARPGAAVPHARRGQPPASTTSSAARSAFENANLEDFVLLRSNGTPMFLLANAVDDADMGITHVMRGEDHVNGTPKYLLIARGARPRATARCSPTCRCSSTSSARSCPSGATTCRWPTSATRATCPRRWSTTSPARLGAARRRRDPADGRDRRAVPARGRHPVAGVLRRAQAAALQRRVHPGARRRGLRRPGPAVLRPRRCHRGRCCDRSPRWCRSGCGC